MSRRQQEEERWVVVRGGALAAEREIVREERNGAAALPMEFCRRGVSKYYDLTESIYRDYILTVVVHYFLITQDSRKNRPITETKFSSKQDRFRRTSASQYDGDGHMHRRAEDRTELCNHQISPLPEREPLF